MRTDTHRPSAINPTEYEFVAFDYLGGSDLGAIMSVKEARERFREHMGKTGGTYAKHENSGSCHICGAGALYICRWYHALTNTYIMTGEDCARKLDMSVGSMNAFRRAVADAREAQAGKRKAIAILADLNLMQAWEIFTAEPVKHAENCALIIGHQDGEEGSTRERSFYGVKCSCGVSDTRMMYEETTITDIVSKLVRYGSISEKASAFVAKLLNNIERRPIIAAQRKAEADAAGPVPTGRVELTGTVLGMKEVDNPGARFSRYASGTITKLLIKLENGSKVFGPRFANLEKGDTVKFIATIEASKDDAKFGFYKRAVLYRTPEEKKAGTILEHAYNSQRTLQLSETSETRTLEGIDAACETLYQLGLQFGAFGGVEFSGHITRKQEAV